MESKLSVLIELFEWLAQYQIKEGYKSGTCRDGKLAFTVDHPKYGRRDVLISEPHEKFFRVDGIGFELKKKVNRQVEIFVYDQGGIYDPVDDRVLGEHYSTSCFALLGAVLFRITGDKKYLPPSKQAIDFHIRTYKDKYIFSPQNYHSDFNNYAFIETYNLLKDVLVEEEKRNWIEALKNARLGRNIGTNWMAKRASFLILRDRLGIKKNYFYKILYSLILGLIKRNQKKDGCIDDFKNRSRPIQYHVYTLALMGRIFEVTHKEFIKKMFLKGVEYFLYFIDPKGDFNFKGRGQEQIFGYGAAIFVLELAKKLDEKNGAYYQKLLDQLWEFVLSFKRKDGHFPLVLNAHPDTEKIGWYDYHHLTVYNAFFGAWIGFACLDEAKVEPKASEFLLEEKRLFKESQVLIVNCRNYYCFFSGGEVRCLSDSGISPHHLYVKGLGDVYSCPGGPSTHRYGRINVVENVEQNFFAPVAFDKMNRCYFPSFKRGCIKEMGKGYLLTLNYGPFSVKRTLIFKPNQISFEDTFIFNRDVHLSEFRLFNFPHYTENFKVTLSMDGFVLGRTDSDRSCKFVFDNVTSGLKIIGMQIRNAKGYVDIVAVIEEDVRFEKRQMRNLKFHLVI